MSFTSLWYFPFLTAVCTVRHFLPGRAGRYFLLAVSWFMYGLFGLSHFLLMTAVTTLTYFTGIFIGRGEKRKRFFAAAGIAVTVEILFYVKYLGMVLSGVEILGGLFDRELSFPERYVVLPVGISFYTFQSLSYVIDVYRGRQPEKNFAVYALFISFFPQLVAGPIEQADRLIPQLENARAGKEDVNVGIRYLISGCVRKFVVADYMAGFVDRVYGNPAEYSGVSLILATLFFAFQIYGDFSGYTHIAIGSARLLGIRLTENFDRPYLARGCRDFWKRWHMTLTGWFTEYVYIPLGGNRLGEKRKYLNIMAVFLLSGLWHGANLTFVVWGAFFGLWRIAEEKTGRRAGRVLTFLLVCIAWVFFRSTSVPEAAEVLCRIITFAGGASAADGLELAGAAVRTGILALLPRVLDFRGKENKEPLETGYLVAVMVFLIAVCMLSVFEGGGESGFIYFQF